MQVQRTWCSDKRDFCKVWLSWSEFSRNSSTTAWLLQVQAKIYQWVCRTISFWQNSHVGKYRLDPPKVLSDFLTSITWLFISTLHYITLWALLDVSHCWLSSVIGQIYFRVGWKYKLNSDWSNTFLLLLLLLLFKKIPPKVWQTPEHLIYQQTGWVWDCGVGRRLIVCLLSSNFFTFPLQGFILHPNPINYQANISKS